MRAVNLMPGDGSPGRQTSSSSIASPVYILLAGLGALVVVALLWTVAGRQIDGSTAKLNRVNAEAQVAEQRSAASAPYEQFAQLARDRKATVASLSATRFDWAHGLREVARVVPDDVWLTAINGTSGASSDAPDPTTSVAPAPRFEMKGCTKSQAKVAQLMARLRAVDGVRSVELKASEKPEADGGEDCPANKPSDPVFTIVISFAVPGQSTPAVDSTGQVSAAAPAAPASPSGSAPAAEPVAPGNAPGAADAPKAAPR